MLAGSAFLLFFLLPALCGATLTLNRFDAHKCSDGSSSGIFVSDLSKSFSDGWVVFYEGGGACKNEEDCLSELEEERWKFSSAEWPSEVQGDSILSDDPVVSPSTASMLKVIVPYCTQDLWLGSKTAVEGQDLSHTGSLIFQHTIDVWRQSYEGFVPIFDDGSPRELVLVGSSAGAIGLANHLPIWVKAVEETAPDVVIRVVLDSGTFTASGMDDVNLEYAGVSSDTFPDCYLNTTSVDVTAATPPCCLVHDCLFTHEDSAFRAAFQTFSSKTSLMVLASPYDAFNVQLTLGDLDEIIKSREFGLSTFAEVSEIAGGRRRDLERSLSSLTGYTTQTSEVTDASLFVMAPSCLLHTILMSASELHLPKCGQGLVKCKFEDGEWKVGFSEPAKNDIEIVMWTSSSMWNQVQIDGMSVMAHVSAFISAKDDSSLSAVSRFLSSGCGGINCDTCPENVSVGDPFQQYSWAVVITLVSAIVLSGLSTLAVGKRKIPNLEASPDVRYAQASSGQRRKTLKEIYREQPTHALTFRSPIKRVQKRALVTVSRLFVWGVAGNVAPKKQDVPKKYDPPSDSTHESHSDRSDSEYSSNYSDTENSSNYSDTEKSSKYSDTEKSSKYSDTENGHASSSFAARGPSESRRISDLFDAPPLLMEIAMARIGKVDLDSVAPAGVRPILRGVNLSLKSGNIYGLLGPSGCGKTTLLAALAHNLGPSHRFCGVVSVHSAKIVYVRQHDIATFHSLTPTELLTFTAMLEKSPADVIGKAFSWVKKFAKTRIKALSGGQRKLLVVANAILRLPDVLLLDEPTSGLDSAMALEIVTALAEYTEKHPRSCIALTIHQPREDVLSLFDVLITLHSGSIHFAGSVAKFRDVFTQAARSSTLDMTMSNTADLALDLLSSNSSALDFTKFKTSTFHDNQPHLSSQASKGLSFCQGIRQVPILVRRIIAAHGLDAIDVMRILVAYVVFSSVMYMRPSGVQRSIILVTGLLGVPVNMARYKILRACEVWQAHRHEVADGHTYWLSLIIASLLTTFSLILPSVALALVPVYLLMEWPFETLIRVALFIFLFIVASLQPGRALSSLFTKYTSFAKWFSIWMLVTFLFGGAIVPISDAPQEVRFLFYLSPTFWAISGTMITVFESDVFPSCYDYWTCKLYSGDVLAAYMGYYPFSTPLLSLSVLGAMVVLQILFECLAVALSTKFGRTAVEYEGPPKWMKDRR